MIPPPTVSGMKTCSAVRRDDVENDAAVFVRRRDVEKAQLVGALTIVQARDLDRVAGIAQLKELHPFDHPPRFHVEAGNNAFGEHGSIRL